MEIMKFASTPPILATPETTVFQALSLMAEKNMGAIVIAGSDQKLLGIFTERDNMIRMSLKSRDPKTTTVAEVMTSPVDSIDPEMTPIKAMEHMLTHGYRHLPIVDKDKRILAVVSLRHLLTHRMRQQDHNLDILAAYLEAGGPG